MPNRKLPPPAELRHLVTVERMTYREIAVRYHCHPSTVPCTIRNDARLHGFPPLSIRSAEHGRRVSQGRRRLMNERGVRNPQVVREIIKDFLRRNQQWTGVRVATAAGVSAATFWELTRPHPRRRTSQAMADKVIAVIDLVDTASGFLSDEHTAPVEACKSCATRNRAVKNLRRLVEKTWASSEFC